MDDSTNSTLASRKILSFNEIGKTGGENQEFKSGYY